MKKLLENSIQSHFCRQCIAIGIIFLATTVVYYNSLHVPFLLDDIAKIVNNPDIKNLSNLKTKLIYPYSKNKVYERNDPSRPVVYFTYALNYYFGKLNTFGYHLFNIIIHVFNAILLFFLTKKIISLILTSRSLALSSKLSEDPDSSGLSSSLVFPLFVALLFAIHPINTEVVTYIYHRSESLAALFYFLSLLLFINATKKNLSIFQYFNLSYVLSLLCFILAIFSKQTAATLPAIILVFDYIFLSDYKVSKVIDKKYYHIPYWIMLIGYVSFRLFYLGGIGDMEINPYSKWTGYTYLITQFYVITKYLKLLFVPIGLCINHIIEPFKSILELKVLLSVTIIISIFILIYKIYSKKTTESKIILFSALWFFITLSPTSSFLPIYEAMTERRLYLPGVAFYLIVIFLYFEIFRIDFAEKLPLKKNLFLFGILMLHILLLGYGTINRNQHFQDKIILWQDVVSQYPNSERAHNNLGLFLDYTSRYEEAEKEYREAIRINPNYEEAHFTLGNLLKDLKRYEEAEKEWKEVIKINPGYEEAHFNLGNLLKDLKRYEEAEKEWKEVIKINPSNIKAHNNLGALLKELSRYEEAEREFKEAIKINPSGAVAHYNLGNLYYELKKYDKALREFEVALKLSPNNQVIKDKVNSLKQLILKNQKG